MGIMNAMRTRMKVILWILLILFVGSMSVGGLVGGADIVNQLFGRVDPSKAIIVIDGVSVSPDLFFSQVDQRLQQARSQGIQYDQGRVDIEREEVYNQIIQSYLIENELKKRKITVSDDEVFFELLNNPPTEIKNIPDFMTNGQFDDAKYQLALQNPQGDEWQPVEQYIRQYLPRQKLFDEISSQVLVSENEIKDEYIINNTNFIINALVVDNSSFNSESVESNKEEIKNYYFQNKEEFKKNEERFLSYVLWGKKPSKNDTLLTYSTVDEILMRIDKGEKFEDLANEFSEDPGNLSQNGMGNNGNLGWFGKGQMVKSFEETAFNLKKGEISNPVETNFGVHIIKVVDKRKNENNEEEILASHILLKIETGPSTLNFIKNKATQFIFDVEDYGFIDALKRNPSYKLNKLPPILKSSTFIPALGYFPQATKFAFDNKTNNTSQALETNSGFVVLKLDSISQEGTKEFDLVKFEISRKIKLNKQKEKAQELSKALYNEIVNNNQTLKNISSKNENTKFLNQVKSKLNSPFEIIGKEQSIIGSLLAAEPSEILEPLNFSSGTVIIQLVSKEEIDKDDWEIKKDLIKNNLLTAKQNQTITEWIDGLKKKAKIIDNRKYYF